MDCIEARRDKIIEEAHEAIEEASRDDADGVEMTKELIEIRAAKRARRLRVLFDCDAEEKILIERHKEKCKKRNTAIGRTKEEEIINRIAEPEASEEEESDAHKEEDEEEEDEETVLNREKADADKMRLAAREVEEAKRSNMSSDKEEDADEGGSRKRKRPQIWRKSEARKRLQRKNRTKKRLEVGLLYSNLFCSYSYIT